MDSLVATARVLLDSYRPRPANDEEAEKFCLTCSELFARANDVATQIGDRFDESLFSASYDLGVVVARYNLAAETVAATLAGIKSLFSQYYVTAGESDSCQQFWDNLLGYRDWDDSAPESVRPFLQGSLRILRDLTHSSARHVRASALHGLNHFPDPAAAKRELEKVVGFEADPDLRRYAQDALSAMALSKRLV